MPNPAKPDAGMHKSHLSLSANIHAKACLFLVKGLAAKGFRIQFFSLKCNARQPVFVNNLIANDSCCKVFLEAYDCYLQV